MDSEQLFLVEKKIHLSSDYSLTLTPDGQGSLKVDKAGKAIHISYSREVEAYRGLTLAKIHEKEENFHLEETPRFTSDGVMLDCSRNGVMSLPAIEDFLLRMALLGLDRLLLYTEDTYQIPEYPYFGYQRGRYSQEELKRIDQKARSFGIELVPCIQTLGHLANPLVWNCFNDIKDNDNVLLADEPKTYDFIRAEIKSCRECFSSHRIHVGMDEAFGVGFGRHYSLHGYEDPSEIFLRHLEKIKGICRDYQFTPLIWSDMLFRLANGGSYYGKNPLNDAIAAKVPSDVGFVYWDYYHEKESEYEECLSAHKKLHNPILFAGGSWRWTGFTPHIGYSLLRSRAGLDACLKCGVKEVFVTGWGDNGNEASFASMYPCLALYSEYSYEGKAEDEAISALLKAVVGESLETMLLLDLPNQPDRTFKHGYGNPSKYLFYQDVIGGLFDKHTAPGYDEAYSEYAQKLTLAAKKSSEFAYAYDALAHLCDVLSLKANLGVRIRAAYQNHDKAALKAISEGDLPLLLRKITAFQKAMEKQWNSECKPYGFDVIDGRIGWLLERIKSAIRRLKAYVRGTQTNIPELEEELLWFDGRKEKGESEVMSWNWWAKNVSVNPL